MADARPAGFMHATEGGIVVALETRDLIRVTPARDRLIISVFPRQVIFNFLSPHSCILAVALH